MPIDRFGRLFVALFLTASEPMYFVPCSNNFITLTVITNEFDCLGNTNKSLREDLLSVHASRYATWGSERCGYL
jgi:hypothetical protein